MHRVQVDDYDRLQAALALTGAQASAAELHGIVCGAICGRLRSGRDRDVCAMIEDASVVDAGGDGPLREIVAGMSSETEAALRERSAEFSLLLPGEDASLEARTEALADWCQGFLLGLLYEGTVTMAALPDDSAEIARDMMAIAEAVTGGQERERDEWDLAQIEEYVRAGVQLIYEELSEQAADRPRGALND